MREGTPHRKEGGEEGGSGGGREGGGREGRREGGKTNTVPLCGHRVGHIFPYREPERMEHGGNDVSTLTLAASKAFLPSQAQPRFVK